MADIINEIWVCQSCMLVHANGDCPCCGDPTMVADWRIPELCPECVEYGCDTSEPCNVPTEDDPWVYADDPRER
jgi:hypothetical protein